MHSTYTFNTIPLLHDGEKAFQQNAYEKSYTFYLCMYLYLVYEPRMFKGISKAVKKKQHTKLEYIKSNSWMAHFSLAPELFDKRADVTHNVRQYRIYRQRIFFIDYVVLLYNLNRDCAIVEW